VRVFVPKSGSTFMGQFALPRGKANRMARTARGARPEQLKPMGAHLATGVTAKTGTEPGRLGLERPWAPRGLFSVLHLLQAEAQSAASSNAAIHLNALCHLAGTSLIPSEHRRRSRRGHRSTSFEGNVQHETASPCRARQMPGDGVAISLKKLVSSVPLQVSGRKRTAATPL
jgi:hypothetical protein